jgi:legumain
MKVILLLALILALGYC